MAQLVPLSELNDHRSYHNVFLSWD